ncbi:S-layer homology domain-containing protein [Paenibacillus sp. Soil522]|uniref:S-layer homology domain-containing protein n=1 Tax=Paenibacillus sp. Soil522 TaxID=1736388 RepID=UPI0007000EF2|nr:S-layer homology domain-containing protein [Paenibacillus sp. Soil522]KRE32527.1 hypothetical protein ASG81_23620 [Paenibacillus sp. Soil522]
MHKRMALLFLSLSLASVMLAGCFGGAESTEGGLPSNDVVAEAQSPVPATENAPSGQEEQSTEIPEESVQPEPVQVNDIAGHASETYITQLLQSGSIKPDTDGNFRPNEAITRSEFIHWMYGYDNKGIKPYKPSAPSFIDVPKEHADFELIEGLHQAGVITGFPDESMKLDKELTREELCLLWAWYQSADSVIDPIIPLASAELSLKPYGDGDKVGQIFIRAVDQYLTNEDVSYTAVFGKTPKLNPQGSVTRAEAAQWIVSYSDKNEQ